jgi:hypothetical protein
MDVATIKVTKEAYSRPHGIMHQHEGGLVGGAKPVNQLVADIQEPGDRLEVIPDALIKVGLCTVCLGGELFSNNLDPFSETYVLETLTH